MRVNTGGLVVAAVFYSALWAAFQRGVDWGSMETIAVAVLSVVAGLLSFGVITESPLGPLRLLRRRPRKSPTHKGAD